MKVKELIKELRNFDKEMEICVEDSERGDQMLIDVIAKNHDISPPVTYVLLRKDK